jgi:branched-chain amino acid transport system permease protein
MGGAARHRRQPFGARLVGIRAPRRRARSRLLLASVIGAISGILIVPITTLYYDTGF